MKDTHFIEFDSSIAEYFVWKYGYYILDEERIGSREYCEFTIRERGYNGRVIPIREGLSSGWLKSLGSSEMGVFGGKVLFDNSDGPLQIRYPVYDKGQYISFVGEDKEEMERLFNQEAHILALGLPS